MGKCKGCFGAANNDCKNCIIMKKDFLKRTIKIKIEIATKVTEDKKFG